MKLVFVTQELDPDHPVLAATRLKVAALAARVEELVVLSSSVAGPLPANCRALSFRAGSRFGRGVRFESALVQELRGLRSGAVVAHMCPIYAVLAAPLARPLGVPVVLWYAHWRPSRLLRAAERLSSAVVSVDRRSFPLPSRKLHAIGHGIDVAGFTCAPRDADGPLRLLALGRYSPAKGLEAVIRAVAETDAGLAVHGPALTEEERVHRGRLERLVEELGVQERVTLGEAVPHARVQELLDRSDALVNNMRAGAPDKAVYEAAASCLPVLASNPVFDELLGPELRFDRDSPADLAERLRGFERLDGPARAAVGRELHRRVEQRHTVEGWADGVLRAAGMA